MFHMIMSYKHKLHISFSMLTLYDFDENKNQTWKKDLTFLLKTFTLTV